jgi:hypothetical protein
MLKTSREKSLVMPLAELLSGVFNKLLTSLGDDGEKAI